ncbi:MAG: hypothetical protein D6753_16930 [Planctomycetota bacterium]|nr:MAG: hypothetical protein D6753_16930 [Planctomycetota bacterium]
MNGEAGAASPVGLEQTLEPAWHMPLWFCIVYAVAVVAFASWVYARERGRANKWMRAALVVLRSSLFFIVLWMLAGWTRQQFETQPPELAIVLDRSASMATADIEPAGGRSPSAAQPRFEWAVQSLTEIDDRQKATLRRRYRIRGFTVAEALDPVGDILARDELAPLAADGQESRLGDGLIQVIRRQTGRGTAAIVFLSDGINTHGSTLQEAAQAARRGAVPIYAVLTGRAQAIPDLRIAEFMMDRDVFLGDRVVTEVVVAGTNVPASDVTVALVDGQTQRTLDQQRVRLEGARAQQNVRLDFVPQRAGEIPLRIEVRPLTEEVDVDNNRQETSVRVQDREISVLIVSDQPSYEFRFLKNLLQRVRGEGDAPTSSFALRCVLQRADAGYVREDPTAIRLTPSDEDEINRFDAFVFLDCDPALISRRSQELIYAAVVERGAGCIFASADPTFWTELSAWPLGDLLPLAGPPAELTLIADQPFRWQPTPLGLGVLPMQLESSDEESMTIWRQLPKLLARSPLGSLRPAAQVLATTMPGDQPVLVSMYAGAGRVALQATDETYRWATFLGSDLYYQRYWGQMLRWLSRGKLAPPEQESQLVVQPRQAAFGQPVRVDVLLGTEVAEADLPSHVQVSITGMRQTGLVLNRDANDRRRYSGTIDDLPPGQYRVLVTQPAAAGDLNQPLEVAPPPSESTNLQPDVEAMRQLADVSRGRFFEYPEFQSMLRQLPPGRAARIGNLPPEPVWNHPWVAALFVMLITTEWLLRRRCRMV